jgi:hypothetical protein
MKKKLINMLIMGILVFSSGSIMAQPSGPPPDPGSETAPIDNGALFLLLAVGYYGYTQLKKKEIPL